MRVRHLVPPVLLAVVLGGGGCTPTLHGRLRTRDPFELPKLESYRSGAIVLGVGDSEVVTTEGHHPPLLQGAWFEVISESEIRFHVNLSHKWQEEASLRAYKVRLRTDRGHDLAPADIWLRRATVQSHDVTVGSLKPGLTPSGQPTVVEETFRRDLHGEDTVVTFRAPKLVSREVRSYTLSLDGNHRRLRFTWDLVPKSELGDDE
jgi:hypothetical protein